MTGLTDEQKERMAKMGDAERVTMIFMVSEIAAEKAEAQAKVDRLTTLAIWAADLLDRASRPLDYAEQRENAAAAQRLRMAVSQGGAQ